MLDFSWSKSITLASGRTVTFRYPTVKDAPKLMAFINPIVEERSHILLNQTQTLQQEEAYLQLCVDGMKAGNLVKICVFYEDRIVGAADIRREPYKQNHLAILGISLSKDFRGEGLGKIVMEELIAQAKSVLGLSKVLLSCSAMNTPAVKLYKKLGFKEYGRLPKAIQYHDELVEQILMQKEI